MYNYAASKDSQATGYKLGCTLYLNDFNNCQHQHEYKLYVKSANIHTMG